MKVKAAKKSCSTILLLFLAVALAGVESVNASNVPVPQFTVQYIDESFDVNTSPSTDPYTGETIPPTYYHVDHSYIQVSFENNELPLIPADSYSKYYYNIRYKGQYTNDWIEARTASDGYYRPSVFTTVNFSLSVFSVTGADVPKGTKIDFQVQLMYGFIDKNISEGPLGSLFFVGETSGWSSTKTVTVGDSSAGATETASPIQTPTAEPTRTPTAAPTATCSPTANPILLETQQGFQLGTDWQTVVIAVLVVTVALLLIVVVLQRKNRIGITDRT